MDNLKKIYKKRKKIILISAGVFLVSVLLLWGYSLREIELNCPEKEIVDKMDFDKKLNLYKKVVKYAWIETEEKNEQGAIGRTAEAYELWKELTAYNISEMPEVFDKGKNVDILFVSVSNNLGKANELAKENSLTEAQHSLEQAIRLLSGAYSEYGEDYYDENFLDFYELIKKVSEAEKKSIAEPYLAELKIAYTMLKLLSLNESLSKIVNDMEKEIALIDRSLDGPDLKRAQHRLRNLGRELFLRS